MPNSPRALGLCLVVGFAACSGRVEIPGGGPAGGSPMSLGGRSANGGAGAGGRASTGGGDATTRPGGASADVGGAGALGGNQDGGASGDAAGSERKILANAPLVATSNTGVTGIVHFTERGDSVDLAISLANCPAGPHAVHLHANAACGDNGSAAGGHWSPQGEGIADVVCGADRAAHASLHVADGVWSIGGPAVSDLLRHSVILHAGPSQPDPGARIACGIPVQVP